MYLYFGFKIVSRSLLAKFQLAWRYGIFALLKLGNYIDTISDQSTAIVGSIDKASRKASWAVGKSKNAVRFETTLDGLMAEASQAVVQSAAGRQQTWDLVRLSQPTDSDQPTADK